MIFVIVISHLEFLNNYSIGNVYQQYFHNPTLAVDFFFMLSGFGMMYSKRGGGRKYII
jgi:peptidoglycan/LPS O-acetylase OafA/YrhL